MGDSKCGGGGLAWGWPPSVWAHSMGPDTSRHAHGCVQTWPVCEWDVFPTLDLRETQDLRARVHRIARLRRPRLAWVARRGSKHCQKWGFSALFKNGVVRVWNSLGHVHGQYGLYLLCVPGLYADKYRSYKQPYGLPSTAQHTEAPMGSTSAATPRHRVAALRARVSAAAALQTASSCSAMSTSAAAAYKWQGAFGL